MADFQETTVLRDVIVNANGSVTASYKYTLSKDGEQIAADVKYKKYAPGEHLDEEIVNLLIVALQRPSN